MSAKYGQFKLDMANAPTFSVGELKELALEASEKIPDPRDFERLFSKVGPLLFNKNIYAAFLVGLGIVEYAKHVMSSIRELEPGESTGVIKAEIAFEKPRTSDEFCAILRDEISGLDPYPDRSVQLLLGRIHQRLGVEEPKPVDATEKEQ